MFYVFNLKESLNSPNILLGTLTCMIVEKKGSAALTMWVKDTAPAPKLTTVMV